MSSPDPEPPPKPRWDQLTGWGWFAVPLFLNLIVLSMPIFDYGYTNSVIAYFSIPYLVMVAIIGVRRARRLSLADFYFLMFGNWAIQTVLWRWHKPHL